MLILLNFKLILTWPLQFLPSIGRSQIPSSWSSRYWISLLLLLDPSFLSCDLPHACVFRTGFSNLKLMMQLPLLCCNIYAFAYIQTEGLFLSNFFSTALYIIVLLIGVLRGSCCMKLFYKNPPIRLKANRNKTFPWDILQCDG